MVVRLLGEGGDEDVYTPLAVCLSGKRALCPGRGRGFCIYTLDGGSGFYLCVGYLHS